MLSSHLAKLDMVWPTLIDYHRARIGSRSASVFTSSGPEKRITEAKSRREDSKHWHSINAPRLAQII